MACSGITWLRAPGVAVFELSCHASSAKQLTLPSFPASNLCCLQVALKAARLACDAHPSSAAAWRLRLQQEAAASNHGSSSRAAAPGQLLAVVKQGLQQVPTAEAEALWLQAFELCSSSPGELPPLQQLLLSAVTRAAAKGPAQGGLGAAASACLQLTWRLQGADVARGVWRKLLLLPPAGGDMFAVMVQLETSAAATGTAAAEAAAAGTASGGADEQDEATAQQLPAAALSRVRAVYDAWVAAYGSADVQLWVRYALFEQAQGRRGPGAVYWRAVKAVEDPDEFIQQYRSRVGLV
eukprot:GHRQ01012254.1.p1 GENE.GHRQ01012254.1~~GHRQ01012254.1.p1  ORF type:complete len:296 (+),score=166.05 GHRQ01012254.1:430-1317(+)